MTLRTTHTCALLQISAEAYAEIATTLKAADYGHVFNERGKPREWMDMTGIGLCFNDPDKDVP